MFPCAIALHCSGDKNKCFIFHKTDNFRMCEFAERCRIQEVEIFMAVYDSTDLTHYKQIQYINYYNTEARFPES